MPERNLIMDELCNSFSFFAFHTRYLRALKSCFKKMELKLNYRFTRLQHGLRVSLWLFVSWGIFMLSSCFPEKESCVTIPPVSDRVELNYAALSDSIININSKTALVNFLGRHDLLREEFFRRSQYPNDSVFINELFNRFSHPSFRTLREEVSRVFGDEQVLRNTFNEAYSNLRYYYPDSKLPRIETVITGLDTDMYVSDTLIIVGLDYYLGPGGQFKPNMYEYLLRQYRPENIVPSVMLVNAMTGFVQTDVSEQTVLADMIAYGKAFYFAKHMQPCLPDSVLIWYSTEEIKGAEENENIIWASLLENQVLYATSHMIKQRYLGDRPFTIEIGEKCPGRIGQWVGWQIVNSYMKNNPSVTMQELMANTNADQLFKQSRYKPVKK